MLDSGAASPPAYGRGLVLDIPEAQRIEMAARAMDALADTHPEVSARTVLTHRQKVFGIVVIVLLLVLAVPFPITVGKVVATVVTLIYGAAVSYRVRCFAKGLRGNLVHRISDEEALAVADDALPVYTVLVPAYREPEVIGALLTHLAALNYPPDKLDVLILLEADDDVTLDAVRFARPGPYVRVAVVPPATLTTKPRACNYGLEIARGSLVTIFDAEDEPDPLQLRKTAVVFSQRPAKVACVQARLAFSNANQNIVTKWFTAEYLTWFNHFLPGLAELGSPIPLGGTSNHLRLSVVREIGGWDPYNVTEDADLGLRMARAGYAVENLDSVTYEEANSDFINWVKQRSRWLKGYLLTWLVHMRHPVQLKRELGWRGFAGVNLFIGGTPLLAVLNPIVWASTLAWFLFKPPIIEELFTGPTYYLALVTWVLGNFAIIYMGLVSIRETARPELLASALLVPLYWVMMALAAVKGVQQLIRDPAYWEKTTHGLGSSVAAPVPVTGMAGPDLLAATSPPQTIIFPLGDRARPVPSAKLRFWQEPDPARPGAMRLVTRAVAAAPPVSRPAEGPDVVVLPQAFVFPAAEKPRQPASVLRLWLEPDPAAPRVMRLVTAPRPADAFIDLREVDPDEPLRELTERPAPAGADVVRAGPPLGARDQSSRRPRGRQRSGSPHKNPGR